jgi:hypothetical protein
MSREGDFAGDIPSVELLAAACIWPIEDAARLAKALQQVGLIAMHPTLRVRGLDRYRSTWLKNHNYHAMSAKGRGHPPVTAEFTKQTGAKPKQTESQDEDEDEEVTTLSTSSTDGPPASVAVVFGHWKLAMKSPRSKLDEKRRRAIAARLAQGFTVDDLKRAIDGCAGDPFSMGQNDRHTKFNTIGLICRDAEHVERFMEKAQAPPSAIPKPRTPTPT